MKQLWQDFKNKGGSVFFLFILAAIVLAVPYFVLFGEDFKDLSYFRKGLTLVLFYGALIVWGFGDKIKLFAPQKESNWKFGHLLWRVSIFALFIGAVIAATA
jgi:hypothetical protein